ncbi:MAG: PDZ domain-containing protein [Verrucomicrobia bacterium]|nr:PDZ domain-containing protein [Verrucomicrobiota bacterium]
MKSALRYLIPAAGLAAWLPVARADDPAPKTERKEMRVIVNSDKDGPHAFMRMHGPREMETVAFLGVETRPTDPTLADQLNLAKGTGLIVRAVVPESPAAGVLKPNDVLVKLDDQLLIESRQLAVLVRNHKEGDEVSVTYIRGGKENTAKVKLSKHDVPKFALLGDGPGDNMFFNLHAWPFGEDGLPGADRADMDRVLALIDQHAPGAMKEMRRMRIERDGKPAPGMHTTIVNTSNSNMVFSDEKGSLDLTIKDGKKSLIAKNAKGEQIFSGPINTPDERKALPPEVRDRLDKLEGMQEFSFQTDDDFEGNVKVMRPAKTKIALPPPLPVPAAPDAPPSPAF